MEGWGLLFEVRYHLGWSGGGPNGQNCPNFIRGDPVGSSRKEKILTKIGDKLDMLQATFWLFFCWDILVLARYEVGRKKLDQKVPNVLQMAGGHFTPPLPLFISTLALRLPQKWFPTSYLAKTKMFQQKNNQKVACNRYN